MGRMTRIPKILHYTFGMAPDFGGKPWSLVHYVCLKSAVERIRPEKVHFYCQFEPSTPWWDLSRDLLNVVKIAAPREIFGRPLKHVAHQSDVVRLQRLIAEGGIYLDADVLVQRCFDDLLDNSTVLGLEGQVGNIGLANAVILAEPNAAFLRRWLDEYRSFRSQGRDRHWNEHSVQLPARLAIAYPEEITVLPPTAFYWPLWTENHLRWIFRSDAPISLDRAYANHLWESSAWHYLQHLTPGDVRRRSTNFHKWALPYLAGLSDDFGAPTMLERLDRIRKSTSTNANA
ncbi:MAG TPA: glycosyltransferase [Rhizomicrobium sp.]